ncbi:MAG: hydantoinase B/oxoprolinase family protein, partial [Leptospiraceae bacterium]|nr:hydantoinase B/oxoprolinase family protein [Leptospiraceae bacterium]
MSEAQKGWHIFADRGGTFTDVLAVDPYGQLHTRKLLSSSDLYEDPIQECLRSLLIGKENLLSELRVGTTIGTNALLERKIAKVGFLVTSGFGDLLRIGYQSRPDLFALKVQLPEMLYADIIEVRERMGCSGQVVQKLDRDGLAAQLLSWKGVVDSVAVVLLHSVENPEHEMEAESLVRELLGLPVYLSHRSSPLPGAVARGDTTLIDAALGPVVQSYALKLQSFIREPLFMTSAGTLVPGADFTGKDSLLSGPAGGVKAVAGLCQRWKVPLAVGFDMGGTSTDVFAYEGMLDRGDATEIGGYRIQAPHLRIHTIASGGGSILTRSTARMLVGPESAGARPGPAYYGCGGPATITDANAVLGRLQSSALEHQFGRDGRSPADYSAAAEALAALALDQNDSVESVAQGFLSIACEQMAGAVRKMTVERGQDPSLFCLVAFGGAGGQVACEVAERSSIERILIPPRAGLFSAAGIAASDRTTLHTLSVQDSLLDGLKSGRDELDRLRRAYAGASMRFEFRLLPPGSDFSVVITSDEWPDASRLAEDFRTAFFRIYGYETGEPSLASVLFEIIWPSGFTLPDQAPVRSPGERAIRIYDGGWLDATLHIRQNLGTGDSLAGPALIVSDNDTVFLRPGWDLLVLDDGTLELTAQPSDLRVERKENSAVAAEIHQRSLESIAIEMGAILQKTARSVNIKERMDFSCALFDSSGRILVSAPHIPVHLGSMQDSVQSVIRRFPDIGENSNFYYIMNDPYAGGTHLPDITVVRPVFVDGGLRYFVAARGHHADVGGISPGSMPARSRSIEEEGIRIIPTRFVSGDLGPGAMLEQLFRDGGARNPTMNVADLAAQVAACNRGEALLQKKWSARSEELEGFMRNAARSAVRSALEPQFRQSELLASIAMDAPSSVNTDQPATLALSIERQDESFVFDFRSSSPAPVGNFQTPQSVVRSAVLYCLYLMGGRQVPLNAGALEDILIQTEGTFLEASDPDPVVAGNVETSQVLVDAILHALGILSPGPGTMNNFSFGNEAYQYYETVGGGTGAGAAFDGGSG